MAKALKPAHYLTNFYFNITLRFPVGPDMNMEWIEAGRFVEDAEKEMRRVFTESGVKIIKCTRTH